jgi:hypothetical protein
MTELADAPAPAAADPLAPDENAPYGYRMYGGKPVPKKLPGRPRKDTLQEQPVVLGRSPSIEDLKAAGFGSTATEDREPGRDPKAKPAKDKALPELPPFRAGPIAKGVNRLYRRGGKIARVFNPAIGMAMIECTRKGTAIDDEGVERVDEDAVTVGEAWEELARTNPRIRRFLLSMLSGGAKMQLLMAHAPLLLAILMTDTVSRRIPFAALLASWMDDEEDGPAAGPMAGMTQDDMAQMMAMAQSMAASMGMRFDVPRGNGVPRPTGEEHPG